MRYRLHLMDIQWLRAQCNLQQKFWQRRLLQKRKSGERTSEMVSPSLSAPDLNPIRPCSEKCGVDHINFKRSLQNVAWIQRYNRTQFCSYYLIWFQCFRCGFLNLEAYASSLTRTQVLTPQRGSQRPENVALLSDIRWPIRVKYILSRTELVI